MNLIIVGNGFDLNEGLETSYWSFKDYLKTYNPDLVDDLQFFYGSLDTEINLGDQIIDFDITTLITNDYEVIAPKTIELWGDLEKNIGNISYASIRRAAGFDRYPIANKDSLIASIVDYFEKTLNEVKKELLNWIKNINCNSLFTKNFIDQNLYISFNYTDTLEKRYCVEEDKICYIHNGLRDEKLLFGCSVDDVEEFKTFQFDYVIDSEFSIELIKVIKRVVKPTRDIIENKLIPFLKDVDIDKIIVLGSSFSKVDEPYFEIINRLFPNKIWLISYYMDKNNEEKSLRGKRVIERFVKQQKIDAKLVEGIDAILKDFVVDADV